MKKHLQPLTPAAFYARVSSDRQDVDLSVSAQLKALKDYASSPSEDYLTAFAGQRQWIATTNCAGCPG